MTDVQKKWREVITPANNVFSLNLKEIWAYRDLLAVLIRRDLLANYKQTILGPVWLVMQPVLTTITFVLIFSKAASFSTGTLPPVLFYLSGIVLWYYFAECITRTSAFFKDNTAILSKVYFPRLIIPLSIVSTNLIKFSIQLALFFLTYIYFYFTGVNIVPNPAAFLLIPLVVLVAGLGLGMGMIISSLSTRYKDLIHLLTFGVQLLMFASPVIFPLTGLRDSWYKTLIMANPMTGIIEAFRYGFLGEGYFSWGLLAYDALCMSVFLILGIIIFNSIEKNFVDTI